MKFGALGAAAWIMTSILSLRGAAVAAERLNVADVHDQSRQRAGEPTGRAPRRRVGRCPRRRRRTPRALQTRRGATLVDRPEAQAGGPAPLGLPPRSRASCDAPPARTLRPSACGL